MTEEPRSPIKDRPLRVPGQSIREERERLIEDKLMGPLLVAVLVIALAVWEWWRYFNPLEPSPWTATIVAALSVGFFGWRVLRYRPQLKRLRLALDGELAVGQFLEALRERGYKVFHDLVSESFNVDHVVIGPAGVFTIETKTWSKPARGEARIAFDGERLSVGGREPDRNPVVQAIAQAGWLRELLTESTGRRFDVRPVVVFPGWFIEQTGQSKKKLWVLNPKALPSFLDNEGVRLSPEDIKLASYHLSRHIRLGEAESA